MHRGCILAEGTLEELQDRHEQPDLEDWFFPIDFPARRAATGASGAPVIGQLKSARHELAQRLVDHVSRNSRPVFRDRRTLFMIAVLRFYSIP